MGLFDKITDGFKNKVDIKQQEIGESDKPSFTQHVNVNQIFPTPVLFSNIGRDYTSEEKTYFDDHCQKMKRNIGNKSSNNQNILHDEPMKNIRIFIESFLEHYLQTVIMPATSVKLGITQSWLNVTKFDEYHHKHAHPNSIISGVLYLNAEPNLDKIYFFKDGYQTIKIMARDFNPFNSDSWWFPVATGDIVLFPSSTIHMVEHVQSKDDRISLAFNTFPIGYLGDDDSLTGLHLQEEIPIAERDTTDNGALRRALRNR